MEPQEENHPENAPSPSDPRRMFHDLRGHATKGARWLELKRRHRIERVIHLQRKRRLHQSR